MKDRIPDIRKHPDAAALALHDHPSRNLSRWRGVLTARAWIEGNGLACFFTDAAEGIERYVLVFKPETYRAAFGGPDMRDVMIGTIYELDVFAPGHCVPIVDRVEWVFT
jgi:hypothetical protein